MDEEGTEREKRTPISSAGARTSLLDENTRASMSKVAQATDCRDYLDRQDSRSRKTLQDKSGVLRNVLKCHYSIELGRSTK